jgi:uncharacterized protein (TIGR04255 family)
MPFPESDRIVFEKNPIAQVIAQIRFEPILKISTELPAAFQDRIRAEYPLYRRPTPPGIPVEIAQLVEQFGAGVESPPHSFLTKDSRRGVALSKDRLTIQTKDYSEWGPFKAKIEEARDALESVYQPPFYTRIGLRYVDVIDRQTVGLPDEPWSSLISDKVLGLLGADSIRDDITEIGSIAAIKVDGLPAGSGLVRLRHGFRAKQPGEAEQTNRYYVVDADFSTSDQSIPDHVSSILDRFNHVAGNLFRWAITPALRGALGQRPLGRPGVGG